MKAGVIAGWFREQSETRVLFATARSGVPLLTLTVDLRGIATSQGKGAPIRGAPNFSWAWASLSLTMRFRRYLVDNACDESGGYRGLVS